MAHFMRRSFSIPGLDDQIEKLEDQIELMQNEIENLKEHTNQLGIETNKLGVETDRLKKLNLELHGNVTEFNETLILFSEILIPEVNLTLYSFNELHDELKVTIIKVFDTNLSLNNTVTTLTEEVSLLDRINAELLKTTTQYQEQRKELMDTIEDLEDPNFYIHTLIEDLNNQIADCDVQNSELKRQNNDLLTMMSYMNESHLNFNTTVEGVSRYLADEINENRALLLKSLQLYYQDAYTFWSCRGLFNDLFGTKEWFIDMNLPIGHSEYLTLTQYMDDNIWFELCVDRIDFKDFLSKDPVIAYNGSSPPVNISYSSLKSGVERYSTQLVDYQFSFEKGGPNHTTWMLAEYNCRNLPDEMQFQWQNRER